MTRKESNRTTSEIKAMMAEDGDFLRPIVRTPPRARLFDDLLCCSRDQVKGKIIGKNFNVALSDRAAILV